MRTSLPAQDNMAGAKGLALLMALTLAEVQASASLEQARGFYLAVGRRLAALEPVDHVADLSALGVRLNTLWTALDWGRVIFCMEDEGIAIRHEGLPERIDMDEDGSWPEPLGTVLEGAYDSWFRALGSGEALRTSRVALSGGTLDLWHGR
ncbi:cellulose biosynthesis protein BcsD [Sphingobium sp. CFD-2]|uniref:cellulose biosynthesis protein BcsD n=1 Tax=Sphingobium sp. CFD-2 TaxID=2878542 RepID=UPI00214C0EF3|nr:cellulose biosynthesis protein BcsD [Sphingobium sp. CFD-2]